MASNAIGQERISRIVGYVIKKGNFATTSPNLPHRIAIFAEANDANQSTLVTDPTEVTSARQAGDLYGYGSPIYTLMRILRPISGDGVGGIPTIVFAQAKQPGAAAKRMTITPVGVATANGTHYVIIAGRNNVDGVPYAINIVSGDTVSIINGKIRDAVNAVLGSPVTAIATDYLTTLTSKWSGLTADGLSVSVDRGDNTLGLTYTVNNTFQAGSGTPSIAAALTALGNQWYTEVLCSYNDAVSMAALEATNGNASPTVPTGRYVGTVFKPFVAIIGSVADNPSTITDARKNEMTIAIAPAPLSLGLAMEAAANALVLYAVQAQNDPHLDIAGQSYPDMPTPTVIGTMADYNNRDSYVNKGCSTVDLVSGKYQVQDFVTTYHPVGEVPPQFRWVRNLNLDWNVRYGYFLLELINVVDHAIANDSDTVAVGNVVKPKQWTGVLYEYAEDLSRRALIVDAPFMQDSISVNISATNPDRFETYFRYKRSGFARQSATTAEAGFNFGTLN
jgi:phage tail sheath gpL-like